MTTLAFPRARLEIEDAVAVLWLVHPEVLNAMSPEMLGGLLDALDAVEDPAHGARCLVVTGEGRAFSAGANLGGDGPSTRVDDAGAVLETHYHPLFRRLRDLRMPIVSAVNGAAAGVGMSLALMGDMVLAARSAYFLQAFRRIGLVPDGGVTWLLPRLVGTARARELSLLGEKLPAETALAWGMINRVYDDEKLLPEAKALAAELAAGPTRALASIRRLYWASPDNTYEQQLDLERSLQREAGRTRDMREGIRAFFEKRKAVFRGE
jgi:2-(1,2-epoxy-1,2-dihydrophenyl)acetyl-CoA isomerase